MFGLGIQGRTHLQTLQETLQFKEIAVFDTADVSAQCDLLASQLGIAVNEAWPEQAVTGADLVITITRSKTPVVDGAWLKPGACVCAVGTSLPSGSEIDATTRQRSSQVIVKWKLQSVWRRAKSCRACKTTASFLTTSKTCQRCWPANRRCANHPDEALLFKAIGVGLRDLVAARLAAAASMGK